MDVGDARRDGRGSRPADRCRPARRGRCPASGRPTAPVCVDEGLQVGRVLDHRAEVVVIGEPQALRLDVVGDRGHPRAELHPVAAGQSRRAATAARRGRRGRRCWFRRTRTPCCPCALSKRSAAAARRSRRRRPAPAASRCTSRRSGRGRSSSSSGFSVAASRGNLPPSSTPSKPISLDVGQDAFQRRVAAQFGHVVVGPGDRADAEADTHGSVSLSLSWTPAS